MSSSDLIVQIISGVLSGSALAVTAFATVFRDTLKRLKNLESKLGREDDPRTGLFLSFSKLNEATHKVERGLEREQDKLDHRLDNMEKNLSNISDILDGCLQRQDYDKDCLDRSKELSSIREQLAASNGLLRGIMSSLEYIKR